MVNKNKTYSQFVESHNIETLEKFPIGRLKKLHKEYKGKGTKEAAREASVIKRIITSRMNEEKEVDDEGGMAMGELKSIASNAKEIMSMLKPDSQLEGWVQSKITKAADYISSVRDYLSNTPDAVMEEEDKGEKKEERETTKSMIARLVAKRAKRLGQEVPADVKRDIDPKYDIDEAVSTNDPKRGKAGRAKPKLPPGQDPYDMYTKGVIKPYGGKTQKRLSSLSPEARKRYYQEVGIRSRAASRAGTTGRLYPQG
jgi:hypothetical protein